MSMIRNETVDRPRDLAEVRLHPAVDHLREPGADPEPRTIVIRQASHWQAMAFLCLCLLLVGIVLLGHRMLRGIEKQNQEMATSLSGFERKVEQLESNLGFEAKRRYLLLGMRDHILRVNPRVSLTDAYHYAQYALEASEKYPSVDPLLLLAIGTVESGYDPQSKSPADARGLYQLWPSTGRLLMRSLGWNYDEASLYDPEKNTQAAALYLDILFSAYSDPQLVLAEYNGGPLNAGYFRAHVGALAEETKNYVPRVLQLQAKLKDQFDKGFDAAPIRHEGREGRSLTAAAAGSRTAH
jgi:Transglycosylase SLT domain